MDNRTPEQFSEAPAAPPPTGLCSPAECGSYASALRSLPPARCSRAPSRPGAQKLQDVLVGRPWCGKRPLRLPALCPAQLLPQGDMSPSAGSRRLASFRFALVARMIRSRQPSLPSPRRPGRAPLLPAILRPSRPTCRPWPAPRAAGPSGTDGSSRTCRPSHRVRPTAPYSLPDLRMRSGLARSRGDWRGRPASYPANRQREVDPVAGAARARPGCCTQRLARRAKPERRFRERPDSIFSVLMPRRPTPCGSRILLQVGALVCSRGTHNAGAADKRLPGARLPGSATGPGGGAPPMAG